MRLSLLRATCWRFCTSPDWCPEATHNVQPRTTYSSSRLNGPTSALHFQLLYSVLLRLTHLTFLMVFRPRTAGDTWRSQSPVSFTLARKMQRRRKYVRNVDVARAWRVPIRRWMVEATRRSSWTAPLEAFVAGMGATDLHNVSRASCQEKDTQIRSQLAKVTHLPPRTLASIVNRTCVLSMRALAGRWTTIGIRPTPLSGLHPNKRAYKEKARLFEQRRFSFVQHRSVAGLP